ncbi:MAG: formate dehydrogenase accessory sulfurtransferase FdhD, partial [Deltaproteobacteria bacterium]|nr:formate dehydrogenase accessory sulfurtransferase FdhD [Deltaproteobacteria bacterium]
MTSDQTKQEIPFSGSSDDPFKVIRCYNGDCYESDHELVGEEPLVIRIEGEAYAVIMRTPGDETFHTAGFCLAEGIVDDFNDFATIGYCEQLDPNIIDVKLTSERLKTVAPILERKGFVSQTSCGICGKVMVEDLCQMLTPVKDDTVITLDQAIA